MIRFYFILPFLFFATVVSASPASNNPPPPEIASLAEQLAPLIKNNPTLQNLQKPDDKKSPENNSDKDAITAKTDDQDQTPKSPVEDAFSQRAAQELNLFGYNQIGQHISEAPTTGQVQDDVILGTGDRVMVTFRGQRDDSKTYTISPQGELIVKALGRITVEADPTVLSENPDRAILLQAGDRIYIPRRTPTVTIAGEVLSPSVQQYLPGKTGNDYISLAGGTAKFADESRTFIVFPDGSASPLSGSGSNWFSHTGIPEGSAIIVPRNPDPLDFLKVTESIGNILSQLAITSVATVQLQRQAGYY